MADSGVWTTASGIPLRPFYGPDDVPAEARAADTPGQAPYLRGVHQLGYRTTPCRIQSSEFGNPEEEAERIRYLLAHGGTGFIMEHNRMTADNLFDVDHPEVAARLIGSPEGGTPLSFQPASTSLVCRWAALAFDPPSCRRLTSTQAGGR